jgi:hypothetical protein
MNTSCTHALRAAAAPAGVQWVCECPSRSTDTASALRRAQPARTRRNDAMQVRRYGLTSMRAR